MKTDTIKLLSLWQPWATLCLARDKDGVIAKPDETRSWAPGNPGPLPMTIAIHATKTWNPITRAACFDHRTELIERGYSPYRLRAGAPAGELEQLPLGAIIGVAVVKAIWATEDVYEAHSPKLKPWSNALPRSKAQLALGDYSNNRFAWELDEQFLLPRPVPFKGKQLRLYDLTGDAYIDVVKQL